jgi:hypothetical protein
MVLLKSKELASHSDFFAFRVLESIWIWVIGFVGSQKVKDRGVPKASPTVLFLDEVPNIALWEKARITLKVPLSPNEESSSEKGEALESKAECGRREEQRVKNQSLRQPISAMKRAHSD